jgi:hypothetical protein
MTSPQSTGPINAYLTSAAPPGVSLDERYLVLPRIVLENLPTEVQHDLAHLLQRVHDLACDLPWPQSYRVDAVRTTSLKALDETGLRQLGVTADLDWNGDLVHREETTGRMLTPAETTRPIAEPYPDPLYH